MEIRFYCDSGANIHSEKSETFTIEDLGLEEGEWDDMSNDEKYRMAEEWAWNAGLCISWEEIE